MRPLLVLLLIVVLVLLLVLGLYLFLQGRVPTTAPLTPVGTPAVSQNYEPLPTQSSGASTAPAVSQIHFRPVLRGHELQVLDYTYFVIGYDNQRKNPAWVSYDLDGPITHPGQEPTRPATFATDFKTSAHVAHRDYISSGYDRGHMAPAYAMYSRYGAEGFLATFTCSNIVPQLHAVNAGIWESLEVEIAGRSGRGGGWAEKLGHVTVINGPVYGAQPDHLKAGVTIPEACFSIILNADRAIAFEIPNQQGTSGPLTRWITTIKKIEDDTGLDVFAGEAAGWRSKLETVRADRLW